MPPSIKRQASDSFSGSQQLVKRQKSNSDLKNENALVVGRGSGSQGGALVQSVSSHAPTQLSNAKSVRRRFADNDADRSREQADYKLLSWN